MSVRLRLGEYDMTGPHWSEQRTFFLIFCFYLTVSNYSDVAEFVLSFSPFYILLLVLIFFTNITNKINLLPPIFTASSYSFFSENNHSFRMLKVVRAFWTMLFSLTLPT